MRFSEARIVAGAVGWTSIVVASGLLVLLLSPALTEGLSESPYVEGVLKRSLTDPFQGTLLAAFVALLPHAVWLLRTRPEPPTAEAYNRFGLWAQTVFTSLGFLGTIIGISAALGGLPAAMDANDPTELIAGLRTAFDTTFLGLSAAIVIMALRKTVTLWSQN